MPEIIVKRAQQILRELEGEHSKHGSLAPKKEEESSTQTAQPVEAVLNTLATQNAKPNTQAIGSQAGNGGMQLSFFQLDDPVLEQIRDELTRLDINSLTPLDALNKLNEIKKLVGGK